LNFFSFEHFREHFREHPPRRVLLKTQRKPATTKRSQGSRAPEAHREEEEIEMTMERLLEVEVGAYGTILEEIELICTMPGFRSRFLVHHIGEGFFRSVGLGPS
jgi:hypothetical protein